MTSGNARFEVSAGLDRLILITAYRNIILPFDVQASLSFIVKRKLWKNMILAA